MRKAAAVLSAKRLQADRAFPILLRRGLRNRIDEDFDFEMFRQMMKHLAVPGFQPKYFERETGIWRNNK